MLLFSEDGLREREYHHHGDHRFNIWPCGITFTQDRALAVEDSFRRFVKLNLLTSGERHIERPARWY
jgi:hypothetical protein